MAKYDAEFDKQTFIEQLHFTTGRPYLENFSSRSRSSSATSYSLTSSTNTRLKNLPYFRYLLKAQVDITDPRSLGMSYYSNINYLLEPKHLLQKDALSEVLRFNLSRKELSILNNFVSGSYKFVADAYNYGQLKIVVDINHPNLETMCEKFINIISKEFAEFDLPNSQKFSQDKFILMFKKLRRMFSENNLSPMFFDNQRERNDELLLSK